MAVKGLTDQFWKLVVKREKSSQDSLRQSGMPHPWKAISEETLSAWEFLDEPIRAIRRAGDLSGLHLQPEEQEPAGIYQG